MRPGPAGASGSRIHLGSGPARPSSIGRSLAAPSDRAKANSADSAEGPVDAISTRYWLSRSYAADPRCIHGVAAERFDPEPVAEVAERLAVVALGLESLEDGHQLGDDLVVRDVVLELDVEPVADGPAAQEDRVGARAGRAVGVACGPSGRPGRCRSCRGGRSRWGSRSSGR